MFCPKTDLLATCGGKKNYYFRWNICPSLLKGHWWEKVWWTWVKWHSICQKIRRMIGNYILHI